MLLSLGLGIAAGLMLSAASRAYAEDASLDFKIYCARCHGESGQGNGPDGVTLHTKPQNFTDCAAMGKLTDKVIFNAIKGGGASVGLPADMPSWGESLSDDQIKALAHYVRGFCKK
ncbi:MAG TPA: c-type cytochrome [Candidatus Binataceae bacterium]|nr:c-type cytochrome [Candidatus Binataceae bacterium]